MAHDHFRAFDVDNLNSNAFEELKPLLLHLNLQMTDDVMYEYLAQVFGTSEVPKDIRYDDFMELLALILQN